MSAATPPAAPAPERPALDARWSATVGEHRRALAAYLETAAALAEDAWDRPWAPGKWTPAHITEHLTLAYEALITEAREGKPMKLRLPAWRRTLLRWVLLPHILFHRSFPVRAPAPREMRPDAARAPRGEALALLAEMGERFEHEVLAAHGRGIQTLTHPYFGGIGFRRGFRFVAVHVEHHHRQIAALR
jgi:hypothetical protein